MTIPPNSRMNLNFEAIKTDSFENEMARYVSDSGREFECEHHGIPCAGIEFSPGSEYRYSCDWSKGDLAIRQSESTLFGIRRVMKSDEISQVDGYAFPTRLTYEEWKDGVCQVRRIAKLTEIVVGQVQPADFHVDSLPIPVGQKVVRQLDPTGRPRVLGVWNGEDITSLLPAPPAPAPRLNLFQLLIGAHLLAIGIGILIYHRARRKRLSDASTLPITRPPQN